MKCTLFELREDSDEVSVEAVVDDLAFKGGLVEVEGLLVLLFFVAVLAQEELGQLFINHLSI